MYKNIDFEEMRILPMSIPVELEGHSIQEVQKEFFLKDLVNNNGEYCCHENDLHIYGKVLVLFQYSNSIVATAILDKVEHEQSGIVHDSKYYFEKNSIAVFSPITSEEMRKIFRIKQLSTCKQRLELSKKSNLLGILAKKNITYTNCKMA